MDMVIRELKQEKILNNIHFYCYFYIIFEYIILSKK
jgi:hypothetical protein